jgi:electron transfer flavoprotein beta subunit
VKIITLVKYSMDVAEIRVDPSTRALHLIGAPQRFGDLDRGAVEAAVRLKQSTDALVEVVCFGPPAAQGAMKDLLAMGADEATVIEDPYEGSADAGVVVQVLEAVIRERGPADMIICGFASDDGYSYQTGPRLAERLGLPFVSYACALEMTAGNLTADRDLEDCLQTVSTSLPAVVSVAEEAFLPRTITLLQAMKAQKKPIKVLSLDDLGLHKDLLDESFGYIELSESGVVANRRQLVLRAHELKELADKFIDALVDEEILVLRNGA